MADTFKTRKKFRVGGSGFTAFLWDGKPIAFASQVQHTAPAPVAQPVVIHPLDSRYPLQIITPGAIGNGQFNISLFEMYNQNIWDAFVNETGLVDLSEIFLSLAARGKPVDMVRVINPPKVLDGTQQQPYGYLYHNCVIMNAELGEPIDVTTMQIIKSLQIGYTHSTKIGKATKAQAYTNTGVQGGFNGNYGTQGYF
jgi:hypothetical protein